MDVLLRRAAAIVFPLLLLLAACLPQTAVLPEAAPVETAVPPTATSPPLPQPSPTATTQGEDPRPSVTIEDRMSTEPTNQSPSDPSLTAATKERVEQAIADLAQRTGLPAEEIVFLSFEFKEWPDSSLGCPQPGMMYAQVLQEGYLIRLEADDQVFNYHGGRGAPFLCEQSDLPDEITKQPPLTQKGTPTISIPPPRD